MTYLLGLSFNQPTFAPIVSWETNGITFANISTLGFHPVGLFIDRNDAIYATDRTNNHTVIWSNGSSTPTRVISQNLGSPRAIFVTNNGDIYIDNGDIYQRVDRWSKNSTIAVPVMNIPQACYGLFVDRNNTLYCSVQNFNEVRKISLGNHPNRTVVAAGTGSCGSASDMLCSPISIFVDINFDLYVADMSNHRIQLFKFGQTNAITVARNGLTGNVILSNPTGVMLDGNGHLFVVNRFDHSIIRSGSYGYHCVVGCSGTSGSRADQFDAPFSIAFDSYGNMFVLDEGNSRIQKFLLTTNSSSK